MGWPEFATLLFSALVAISTVVYAILTYRLVRETRHLREVQTEPKIEVFIKPFEESLCFLRLFIKNIGLGPAYNISFEINPETQGEGEKLLIADFSQAKFLSNGLRYLGPNQQLEAGYTQITDNFKDKIKAVLLVKARYNSLLGREYETTHRLDLAELEGITTLGTPNLYSIAKSLEKMQRDIDHFSSGHNKLKVDIYTNQDREIEMEKRKRVIDDLHRKAQDIKTQG